MAIDPRTAGNGRFIGSVARTEPQIGVFGGPCRITDRFGIYHGLPIGTELSSGDHIKVEHVVVDKWSRHTMCFLVCSETTRTQAMLHHFRYGVTVRRVNARSLVCRACHMVMRW